MIANKGRKDKRLHIGNRFLIVFILTLIGLALALPSFAFAADVWQNAGLPNEEVNVVHVSPNYLKDYTLFAGTATKGVYRSTDKGKNWAPVNTGLTNLNIRSVAVSLGFATDNTVFAATAGGVFKSTNKGDSWGAVNTGLPTTDIRTLAVSPTYATDHTVFVGTNALGIFKTTDGGASWSSANTGLANMDIRAIAVSPNFGVDKTMFVGTYGGGVFKSTDSGATWQAANSGLTNALVTDIALSLDFPTDHVMLVGTYGGGVFQSTTAGSSWVEANVGIPSADRYVLSVAISPGYTRSKDGTCFAGTTNGVYKSTTQGAQWAQINNGLMHKLIPSIDPTPCYCLDKTVYAGSDGGGVYSCIFSAPGPGPSTILSVSNPSYPDGDNGWFKTAPTLIMLDSSAPGTTYYQWDSASGPWTVYTGAFTAIEGKHTLYYYSQDTSGGVEPYKDQSFNVDTTLPTNPTVTSPSHTVGTRSLDNTIDITFSGAADSGSGLDGYSVGWSQSSTTIPDTTVDMTGAAVSLTSSPLADGNWYFHLSTKDLAGNWSNAVHLGPFTIDAAAPTTSLSSVPAYTGGWMNAVPSITLARNEPGITYYQWDSTSTAGWTTYSTSFNALNGQHTLYFYSKDTVGNIEAVIAQVFKVDTLSPTAFTLASPANNSSTSNITNPTFAWNASSDSGSGMAKYQLYIDGAMKQETSATSLAYTLTSPLAAGTHTWYVKAFDMSSNSLTSTATFTLNVGDVVAPNTTISSNPSYSGGWVKTSPSITLTRDESGTTYYQWDSTSTAGWQTYAGSITASEGQHTLNYYSKDISNNAEPVKSQPFSVDSSVPSAFNLSGPANNSSTNNASTPTFTWTASTDSGSGVAKYQLYIDNTLKQDNISSSQTSYTLSSPLSVGTHTWFTKAVDSAGNAVTSTASNTLNVADVVPPVTSMATSPSYTSGWFKTAPSITLTRNELGTTYYQWDSTSPTGWQTYTGSITAQEGQHTLYYYSKDTSNNTEANIVQSFKVDLTPPSGFDISLPASGSSTDNKSLPTFTWTASTDSGSGVAKYQLYIDNTLKQDNISSSQTSYTLTSPLAAGTHTWHVQAVDSAGHVANSTSTFTLIVNDVVPPATTISTSPSYASGANGWFKTAPVVTLTANELGTISYQLDSSGLVAYTGSFTVPEGQHTLTYYSVDTSSNTETNKTQSFKVDTIAPSTFDMSSPANGSSTDNASLPTFTWTASSDSGSGIVKYQLYVDGLLNKDNISPSSTSYTITTPLTPGTHTWYVQAVDSAGNTAKTTSTFTITVADVVPPVTTVASSPSYPDGTNGWYKSATSISLSRNEAGATYYQWDATSPSGWVVYTGTINAIEGQHTLNYYSEDTSANQETVKSKAFKVDTVMPSTFDISSPANNSPTNNASYPTFSWGASSDINLAKYQLYIDGALSKDSISPSSTSYTITTPLTPGTHTWYVQAVDSAGNAAKATSTFTLTVNDIVPPTTTIAPSPSYPDGLNGWYKSTPSVTLTRSEAGTTYYQWDSTSGAWTSFPESLATFVTPEGQHTLYYYSEDTGANKETVKSKAFKVDITIPPAFDISSPANNSPTNNASYPTFSWGASSDINLAKYQLYIDGALNKDSISPSSTSYTITTPLTPGTHTWYVQAVDSAGNAAKATSTFTITVADVVPPVTTLSTNLSGPDGSGGWFLTAPVVTLTRNEPGVTHYQWDSTSPSGWQTYATGGITGSEGKHTLYYYSEDTSVNTETVKSKAFNIDLSAPAAFNISSPANNSSTNNMSYPTFSWTASSDSVSGVTKYQLYVDGSLNKDNISASSTSYTLTTPLDTGTHTWSVKAVDAAGNVANSTATFTINVSDVTPPVTTLSTNPSGPDGSNGWFKARPSILLTRNEPGTTYYQVDSTSTGGWTVYTSASAGIGAQEGQHTAYFYSADSYNNTETIRSQSIKIDTSIPLSTITSPVNGAHLSGTSCTIGGTASDAASSGVSKVEISINDGIWVTASGTTTWSYSWPLPADGNYTIKSRVTDIAGNVETVGSGISVLVDKAAPSVVSNGPADAATNVSIASNITAVFSEDIDQTTINGTTFTLKDNNNNPVAGTVTFDQASRTATFRPSSPLNYSTTYTATISTGVKDMAGTGMAANKIWSFATMLLTSSPITSLYVNPASPNGTNGWYNAKPTITLISDRVGTTFYQWDSASNWQVYPGSPLAGNLIPEGQHTLYYCSVSSGITETANNHAFKIDVTPPPIPANVKAVPISPATIQLTWDASTDNVGTTGYNIYDGSKQKIGSTASNSFDVGNLQQGTPYSFYVKAYDAASNISDFSSVATTSTLPSQQTGSGTGVTVRLPGVELEFSRISKDGTTTASIDTSAPFNEPANFKFRGTRVDVQTTASYTGDITITISYDPSQVNGNPKNLKLMHWNGQRWENITVSVDTVAHTITGITKSLSPFGVGEDLITGIGSGNGVAYGMNTDLLLAFSLTLMISGAWLMLRRRSTV